MGANCVCDNDRQSQKEQTTEVLMVEKRPTPQLEQAHSEPEEACVVDVKVEQLPSETSDPSKEHLTTPTQDHVLTKLTPGKDCSLVPKCSLPVTLNNGVVYKGEWNAKGQRHGSGIEEMPDGSVYEGCFSQDLRSGQGKLTLSENLVYEGSFANNLPNGRGKFLNSDGSKYEGEFLDGFQHGEGIEKYPDGSVYQGNFKQGKKSGTGTFKWPNGKMYTGEFENDIMNGEGKCFWANGKHYSGPWVNGKMHGKKGVFEWPDGKMYRGTYYQDKKHGKGKFYWPDGRILKGEWENGLQHGEAIMLVKEQNGTYSSSKCFWNHGKLIKENSTDVFRKST